MVERGMRVSFAIVTDGFPNLTWHSVWDLRLESRVIKTWEAVALEYSSGQTLCVEVHQIPIGNVRSCGDAIDYLKLII
jgi:hypothetical protein